MPRLKEQKLYEYTYEIKDPWGDSIEFNTGDILAEDMRDAVDRAIQTIQLKNLHMYECSMSIDILEIKVISER